MSSENLHRHLPIEITSKAEAKNHRAVCSRGPTFRMHPMAHIIYAATFYAEVKIIRNLMTCMRNRNIVASFIYGGAEPRDFPLDRKKANGDHK